ncbi:hypothetical protein [Nocardioides sp. SR21]|uniref:hypothetical protein n=1 Tax=Nocardioides sp. SR21 TaxID=2919501 RepID=UPI001FAAB981|nr:hypothetical protein [Nocardioides sp. SR21]
MTRWGSTALLPLLLVLAACGSASVSSPPSGVDELVIPTPGPDPADFVDTVDNPWFPLEPGTTWTYTVNDTAGAHPMTVTVEPGPEVAGVPTTARVTTEGERVLTDWFAQDDRGNVWWFGREDSWEAGVDGAEAGLAMAETPRVGDGYRPAFAPGVSEDTATVTSLDDRVTVPVGTFETLLVDGRSELEPGVHTEWSYAEGLGLVAEQVVSGSYRSVRLERVEP